MSMRVKLFAILMLMTGVVWLSACIWIYTNTRARLEHVLDARLIESARMVSSLVGGRSVDIAANQPLTGEGGTTLDSDLTLAPSYDRQLACQIWSISGRLLSKSESAPSASLSDHASGFENTFIHGAEWRVYAVAKPELGVRVLVGDSVQVRDRLVDDVIKGLLYPALLIMPLMAGLIWLSLAKGLAPLRNLAVSLTTRDATELHPFEHAKTPTELRPMIQALNSLLGRVQAARDRERDFTTYAAHELKTPLAGLKTQAQVAMRSTDPEVQRQALKRIEQSVDRTSRMAKQLIDLAAVDAADEVSVASEVDVASLVTEIVHDLEGLQRSRSVRVTYVLGDEDNRILAKANAQLLRLALRNVIENAVQHSPPGSMVECRGSQANGKLSIIITDEGPGIASDEQGRVLQRFYRSPKSTAVGSGLGLAIVKMAMDRINGRLEFARIGRKFAVLLEV